MRSASQTPTPSLGQQVREARLAHDLSVEGLAFKAGVSYKTILRLERDEHTPRRATLRVIADELDLDFGFSNGEAA